MSAIQTEVKKELEITAPSTTNDMVFNPAVMQQMSAVAEVMASGRATVPKHLQGSIGDCFAIIMQAAQWKMNPFAVAQKTHIVNGTLGYEAQLVNAVVSSSRAIKGRFVYEYIGDWSKHNTKGSDAAIRVGAVLNGEDEITFGEPIYVGDVTIKNSPLWKTAPKQQAAYLAVKYWARMYCPEVIMGVYSADELETIQPTEKEINPAKKPQSKVSQLKEKAREKAKDKAASTPKITLESVIKGLDNAKNEDELALACDIANELPESDKNDAREKYKVRFAEIAQLDTSN